MDPSSLAALPLSGLLLLATFWVLTSVIGWITDRMTVDAARRARQARLDTYLRYTANQFRNALPVTVQTFADYCPETRPPAADDSKTRAAKASTLDRFGAKVAALFLPVPAPASGIGAAANVSPGGTDDTVFAFTEGEIDLDDISAHLGDYDPALMDYITIFLEKRATYLAELQKINTFAADPAKELHLFNALYRAQFDVFILTLVSQAIWDRSTRDRLGPLLTATSGRIDETVALPKLIALARDLLGDPSFDLLMLTDAKRDGEDTGNWHTEPVSPDPSTGYPGHIETLAQDVTVPFVGAQPGAAQWLGRTLKWPLLILAPIVLFGLALWLIDPLRDLLYPTDDPYACTSTVTASTGEVVTKCTFTADTLPDGLPVTQP